MERNLTIGFVGTGVMGKSMAKNLQLAGYPLHIYTRTKEKAQQLIDEGAIWKETIADLASSSDVIITIVGYPSDVEEVYFNITDRKSTRLNSSHVSISYAVFCLKKKTQ